MRPVIWSKQLTYLLVPFSAVSDRSKPSAHAVTPRSDSSVSNSQRGSPQAAVGYPLLTVSKALRSQASLDNRTATRLLASPPDRACATCLDPQSSVWNDFYYRTLIGRQDARTLLYSISRDL